MKRLAWLICWFLICVIACARIYNNNPILSQNLKKIHTLRENTNKWQELGSESSLSIRRENHNPTTEYNSTEK